MKKLLSFLGSAVLSGYLLLGCSDASFNPAAYLRSRPQLQAEEHVPVSWQYESSEKSRYVPVTKPSWLDFSASGFAQASDPLAGEHALEFLLEGENGVQTLQTDTLYVFLSYDSSGTVLESRAQDYITSGQWFDFEIGDVPGSIPVGGLDDPATPQLDDLTVFVDYMAVTNQGVRVGYNESFSNPHVDPADTALLEANFYHPVVIDPQTSTQNVVDSFDAEYDAMGFSVP